MLKLLLAFIVAVPLLKGHGDAAISYVVLDWCSVERISNDGNTRETLTDDACGYRLDIDKPDSPQASGGHGLAVDREGNYAVAAVSALLKVARSGGVSIIAKAPAGSGWVSVAVDSQGQFILADNRKHAVWRVSADGQEMEKVAAYPAHSNVWESASIVVDPSGDYLLIEDNNGTRLWRIAPTGKISPIALHGGTIRAGCQIITDGLGNYLVSSLRQNTIFRLTPEGVVTTFAQTTGFVPSCMVLARDPDTGDVVAGSDAAPLSLISADGKAMKLIGPDVYPSHPTGIVAERHK